MDTLYTLEVAVNLFLQHLGGWLTAPMQLFSFFGQEQFFMLLLPVIYWCIDSSVGLRMGAVLLLSNFINTFFKMLLHGPRPYWIDSRVKALASETSFGIPSGHSQTAAMLWGFLASVYRKKWAVIGAVVLVFFIGLSRLYLGVHFLRDVLSGWLLGALFLWAFLRLEPRVSYWVTQRSLVQQIALAAASSIGLILVSMLSLAVFPGYMLPDAWAANASAAFPEVTINPLEISGLFTIGGTWFGMLCGAAWIYHTRGKFDAQGSPTHRLLRFFIGLIGILLLWQGLGTLLPEEANLVSYLLRYLRYSLVGLWVSALAPMLFVRIGIAQFIPSESKQHQAAAKPELSKAS